MLIHEGDLVALTTTTSKEVITMLQVGDLVWVYGKPGKWIITKVDISTLHVMSLNGDETHFDFHESFVPAQENLYNIGIGVPDSHDYLTTKPVELNHDVRSEMINNLIEGLLADEAHHKQWFIEQVLKSLGVNLDELETLLDHVDLSFDCGVDPRVGE